MTPVRRTAWVLLWSVIAVACGSGGSDNVADRSASTTTTTATTIATTTIATTTTVVPTTVAATTSTRAPSAAADKAVAQRILLTAGDVPTMATAKPAGFFEVFARCGRNQLLPGGSDPRQATPIGFLKDETAEVRRVQTTALGAYAALAPTEQAARAVLSVVQSPEFRTCVERELFAAVNAQGAGAAQGSSATDLPTPAIADGVAGFRITITGRTAVGQEFEITTVRKGRAIASVATSRLGTVNFPTDERVRLVRVMAGRMP